jgi:hypothetical protein
LTEEEALIYLPIENRDDLVDFYEEKLFEYQQFFASRMPINKLYISRLSRLEKLHEAFVALGGKTTSSDFDKLNWDLRGTHVREVFNDYHKIKGQANVLVLSARSAKDIAILSEKMLQLTRDYSKHWNIVNDSFNYDGIVVSKEPDPMDILKSITEFESNGMSLFSEILKLDESSILMMEAKRLSLWLKMYHDAG